jgi:hypothetical protein
MDSYSSCRPGRGAPRRGPRAGSPQTPSADPFPGRDPHRGGTA